MDFDSFLCYAMLMCTYDMVPDPGAEPLTIIYFYE